MLRAVFLLSIALAACSRENAQPTGIAWSTEPVEAVFESARDQDKPVLVYWSAEWCPYCKALETTVFTRPDFAAQAARGIAVKLDGDQPEAQKWGTQFGVIGYPTLLLFRPDGVEIARVSGGMGLEQYAQAVARVLDDPRPIAEVLQGAGTSAEDCRRLAWHGWDLESAAEESPPKRAEELQRAAERCPESESIARLRLSAIALGLMLVQDSEAIQNGQPAKQAVVLGARSLLPLLRRPDELRGVADVLASLDDALYRVVKNEGPEFANEFREAWISATLAFADDAQYGESDRLTALATALDAEKQFSAEGKLSPELAARARGQLNAALSAGQGSSNRHDIINAARIVYTVLEDEDALYVLLFSEIAKSATPYYYMPTLASIDEKRGRTQEALDWNRQAYEATRAPGARVRWGTRYVAALARMAPDNVAAIEKVALEVADAYNERDRELATRGPERGGSLRKTLTDWATTEKRKVVLQAVEARLSA